MHRFHKYLFFIILLITGIVPLKALEQTKINWSDSIRVLLDSADVTSRQNLFRDAEIIIDSAETIFKRIDYPENSTAELKDLYFKMQSMNAWIKTLCEKYSEAEPIYFNILKELPDTAYHEISEVYMQISSLYGMQKLYEKSKTYALKALEYANLLNDTELIFHARSNLGDIYFYTKQYDKALAEYHEVRKLSIMLKKYDAISLGNLALAYHYQNKIDIAEQYYKEALQIAENENSIVFSIILPEYCKLLVSKGDKIKARRLASKAIKDERNLQKSDYNLILLNVLAQTDDAYRPVIISVSICVAIIIIALIIVVLRLFRIKKKRLADIEYIGKLESQIEDMEKNISAGGNDKNETSNEQKGLTFLALSDSIPDMMQLIQQIKYSAGNKTEVVDKVKSLEQIIAPFNEDKIKKEISQFLEQESLLGVKLKKAYPDLNLSEIKLCIMIKEGLSTKEIANVTNRSVRGIESAKFRMRKKMNLTSQKDIYDCLLELESNNQ